MGISIFFLEKGQNYSTPIACVQRNLGPYLLNYYNIPAATRAVILIRLSVLLRKFFYETKRKLLINGDKSLVIKARKHQR